MSHVDYSSTNCLFHTLFLGGGEGERGGEMVVCMELNRIRNMIWKGREMRKSNAEAR